MAKFSNNPIVFELVQACISRDVKHIVISPGSRNAPLILSFAKSKSIKCYSVVDERVAGFFALGISQQTREVVALCCTSGTAVLNYAPAVSEAYYQYVPLLVISADRPKELVDQAEGQVIRQENILHNIVEKSYQLPSETASHNVSYARRLCNEGISICKLKKRPVHFNIPLWEPLYELKDYNEQQCKPILSPEIIKQLHDSDLHRLQKVFSSAAKVLIVVGFIPENCKLNTLLEKMVTVGKAVVLTETVANLKSPYFHYNIDRLLATIGRNICFVPDLLITCGGTLISKIIKTWLRSYNIKDHWHVHENEEFIDTFQCLTENICMSAESFFEQFSELLTNKSKSYVQQWNDLEQRQIIAHDTYLSEVEWSDLQVFDLLLSYVPYDSLLHLGNSTVVRYHQLFKYKNNVTYFSNRGTSGIDGCISTAVGAAYIFDGFTTIIVGDISLGYDSNALWHKYVSHKLRIIVINNGGGGIFRFMEESSKQEELEDFFETKHSAQSYQHLAAHWGIEYYLANNKVELEEEMQTFYKDEGLPKLLEINTPCVANSQVLRGYFEFMKKV